VIPEPAGGAHSDWARTAADLKSALLRHLGELKAVPGAELTRRRMEKYLRMGQWCVEGE
jgi:acetyl-CoA carboxylase carboxyl transferase subunit alpha